MPFFGGGSAPGPPNLAILSRLNQLLTRPRGVGWERNGCLALETDPIGPPLGIVDRSNERLGETPLVPNSVGIHTSPDMDRDRLPSPHRDRGGERDEEREPAEHSFGVRLRT